MVKYACPVYVEESPGFQQGNGVFLEILVIGTEKEIFGNKIGQIILANSDDIITLKEMLEISIKYHENKLSSPSRKFLSGLRNSFFLVKDIYKTMMN